MREKYIPKAGSIYENAGGGSFKCIKTSYNGEALMRNIRSGWTFIAHGIGIYPDGKIDWDWSRGGAFEC